MVTRFKGMPTLEEGMYSFIEQLREYNPLFAESPVPEAWDLVLRVHGGQLRNNGGSVAIKHLAGSAVGLASYITSVAPIDSPHYGKHFPKDKWPLYIARMLLHDMEEDIDPSEVPEGWDAVFANQFGTVTGRELYQGVRPFNKPKWEEMELPPNYSVTRRRLEADRLGIRQIADSGDITSLISKFEERLQNLSDPVTDDPEKMAFGAYKTRAHLLPIAAQHSAHYSMHLHSAIFNIQPPESLEELERILEPVTV